MVTRWRRRRITRRIAGLVEQGEELVLTELLGLGGWWVLSDRALYVVGRRGEPVRLPLQEIRSVRIASGSTTQQVTVVAGSSVVVGDLHRRSDLAERLRNLPPAPGSASS